MIDLEKLLKEAEAKVKIETRDILMNRMIENGCMKNEAYCAANTLVKMGVHRFVTMEEIESILY
jgi:hypothetical protein